MSLLNKLTIKNLKLNKKRTTVTIIGIMLAVALITATASMFASMIKTVTNYTILANGNYHVAYYNVPVDELETFKNNRTIETINATKNIGYAKIDSKDTYKPYANLQGFTKNSLNNLSIKLVDGRLPENDNEILIPTHLKTTGRIILNVGDTITLNIGQRADTNGNILNDYDLYHPSDTSKKDSIENEKIIDTKEKTYKIVGIMERPAESIEPYFAPGYTFITYKDEKDLNEKINIYTRYTRSAEKEWVKTTANILGTDTEHLNTIIEAKTKEKQRKKSAETEELKYAVDINQNLINLEIDPLSKDSTANLPIVIAIVIGIIIITSTFCIKNSFDISITEKIKQYGILRSVGATKKQIRKNVFYEATALGTMGIPLGILLGIFMSYILIIISNYFFKNSFKGEVQGLLEFSISSVAIIASVLSGIITIYFSAFRSARKASKISPIDSIKNSANIKINPKKIKSPKIIKKIFGIGGEISFKNLKRNKKKYRTTVVSIVVSVFVFISLSSFMNMSFDAVKNKFKTSDYNISLTNYNNNNEETFNKFLETTKLDNIENYTVLRSKGFKNEDTKYNPEYLQWTNKSPEDNEDWLYICSLGKEQYNKYINSLGLKYDEIKDKAILMDYHKTKKSANEKYKPEYKIIQKHNYQSGETLKGTLNTNDNSQIDFSIEIGHITDVKPFGLSERFSSDSYLIVSEELYNKITANEAFKNSIEINYKSSNPDNLQNDIDELLKGEVYYLTNVAEIVNSTNNLITLMGVFLYGFIAVISLIGITNIFNTITTNMELRKQELAMLKAVGMTTKEFNRMIRLETLFMGVKSLLFSLPIGIALSHVIYHFFSPQMGGIPYKLPIIPILISIGMVFILISLIMKYSINKINKQSIIETIRNENI